ncbi:MAG: hypothetical protein R6V10_12170 [bacterium]
MKKKNLKKFFAAAALFGAALLLAYPLFTEEARGEEEKKSCTVKAEIDKECKSHPETFTVPEGKTAKDFKKLGFEAGEACHDSGAPENQGFAVRDSKNRPVYMWSQYKDQPPYEKGGPLESLTLEGGEYTLSVAGGAGAMIELSYEVE